MAAVRQPTVYARPVATAATANTTRRVAPMPARRAAPALSVLAARHSHAQVRLSSSARDDPLATTRSTAARLNCVRSFTAPPIVRRTDLTSLRRLHPAQSLRREEVDEVLGETVDSDAHVPGRHPTTSWELASSAGGP
jgi:hypothetical protein